MAHRCWQFLNLLALALITAPSLAAFEIVRFEAELNASLEEPVDVAVTDAGDVLVLDADSRRVLIYSPGGELRGRIGGSADLSRPVAVAAGPDGVVAVADEREDAVLLFNLDGELLGRFGGSGSSSGEFGTLVDVDIDHFGFIYTSDSRNRVVSRFSRQGILLSEMRFRESQPGTLSVDRQGYVHLLVDDGPEVIRFHMRDAGSGRNIRFQEKPAGAGGIYVDLRGDLYVTRSGRNNVLKFARDGALIASFGSRGKGPGAFSRPTRLDGDSSGRIYIVDSRNERVQIFTLEGNEDAELALDTRSEPTVSLVGYEPLAEAVDDLFVTANADQLRLFGGSSRILRKGLSTAVYGAPGRDSGELRSPRGVAALSGDRMVVADTGNNRLQIFGADGSARVIGERGREPGFFQSPMDVAVSSDGIVFVADAGNSRIQMFTDQGIYLYSFGEKGSGRGGEAPPLTAFDEPVALAIGPDDRVHVADVGNQRVVSFDAQGQPLQAIEGLSEPVDIAVDGSGNLFVADNVCHCIRVFSDRGEALLRFGSAGDGPGRLGEIRSLAVVGDQVLVYQSGSGGSDPLTAFISSALGDGGGNSDGGIKTFKLAMEGIQREERVTVLHSFYVPEAVLADRAQLERYRNLAMDEVVEKLAAESSADPDAVRRNLRVDSEDILSGGEVRLTASVPADLSTVSLAADQPLEEETAEEEAEVELAF